MPTKEYLALVEAHRARAQGQAAKHPSLPPATGKEAAGAMAAAAGSGEGPDGDDEGSGPEAGPAPIPVATAISAVAPDHRMYGKDLLKGEGAAMAEFVNKNERIPRRGEIGLTADEIANYEKLGFVMSGSRHKKMTAVRLRKEGQVLSSSERIDQVLFNAQAKAERENKVIEELRKLAKERERK